MSSGGFQLREFNFFKRHRLVNVPNIFSDKDTIVYSPNIVNSGGYNGYSGYGKYGSEYMFAANKRRGYVYIIDRELNYVKFLVCKENEVNDCKILKLLYNKSSNCLITISEDSSSGFNLTVRVWDLKKLKFSAILEEQRRQRMQRSESSTSNKDGDDGSTANEDGRGKVAKVANDKADAFNERDVENIQDDAFVVDRETLKARKIPINRLGEIKYLMAAITISEDMKSMAVGFADGQIIVYKGDLTNKGKKLKEYSSHKFDEAITNMHYTVGTEGERNSVLFVTTTGQILVISRDTDSKSKVVLENRGCAMGVSTINKFGELVVGQDEAIYFYNLDGRGPCFAYESKKVMIRQVGERLVLLVNVETGKMVRNRNGGVGDRNESETSNANKDKYWNPSASNTKGKGKTNGIGKGKDRNEGYENKITRFSIIDIKNKLVAASSEMVGEEGIKEVAVNWGGIFVVGKSGGLDYFEEEKTSRKLEILYQQHQYPLAIKMCSGKIGGGGGGEKRGEGLEESGDEGEQEEDAEYILAQVYQKYGDYLMGKNEADLAVNEYVKTIGQVEASYVICKFLEAQYVDQMQYYLEKLVEKKAANSDHVLLLLTCYAKNQREDLMNEFLENNDMAEEGIINVEQAIRVSLKEGQLKVALGLARRYRHVETEIEILVHYIKDHRMALESIMDLYLGKKSQENTGAFADASVVERRAEQMMLFFGKTIVASEPEALVEAVLKLVVKNRCTSSSTRELAANKWFSQRIYRFSVLFDGYPEWLILYYERAIEYQFGIGDMLQLQQPQTTPLSGQVELGTSFGRKTATAIAIAIATATTTTTGTDVKNKTELDINKILLDNRILVDILNKLLELYLTKTTNGNERKCTEIIKILATFDSYYKILSTQHKNNNDVSDGDNNTSNGQRLVGLGISNYQPNTPNTSLFKTPIVDYDYIQMLCSMCNYQKALAALLEFSGKTDATKLVDFYFSNINNQPFTDIGSDDGEKETRKNVDAILSLLDAYPNDDALFINTLKLTASSSGLSETLRKNMVGQILGRIERTQVLDPIRVLTLLSKNNMPTINFGMVKEYLKSVFERQKSLINQNEALLAEQKSKNKSITAQIDEYHQDVIVFSRAKICNICLNTLDEFLPIAYFMCKHSFHYNCVLNKCNNDPERLLCPVCKFV